MADLGFPCSIRQGYNFEKDQQVLVGHLVSLKIGATEFKADTTLTDPNDNSKSVAVLGPISYIYWKGGYADPVSVVFNVSTANQTLAWTLTHSKMEDTYLEFKFNIYAFDQVAKTYYKAFHTDDKAMKGYVLKSGGDLALSIGADPNPTVPSPLNYDLQLDIMPKEEAQVLLIAASNTDKLTKAWGVTVTK